MSGPQFVHFQSFSRKANKGGQSVDQILGEAMREPQFSKHVANPEPPNLIYGVPPEEVARLHAAMIENGSVEVSLGNGSKAQRGIRKDRHTLFTVVASYPLLAEQVAPGSKDRKAYERWIDLNVQWLKSLFGDRLVSVIEHIDEKHPHIHAFILPLGDAACSARDLNPAWKAKEEAESRAKTATIPSKEAVKLGNLAYRNAARKIQDDYSREVGMRAGLTRTGPKRARMSRAQWKMKKAEARRDADLLDQMDARVAAIADIEAGAEAVLEIEKDRAAAEIVAKLELVEAAQQEVAELRIAAQREAASILEDARQSASMQTQQKRIEVSDLEVALRAELQRAKDKNALFEREQVRQRNTVLRETISATVRVILGVMAGTVSISVDRERIEIRNQSLANSVKNLGIDGVLYGVVEVVEALWKKLTSWLSEAEIKAEQNKAAQVLEPHIQPATKKFEP